MKIAEKPRSEMLGLHIVVILRKMRIARLARVWRPEQCANVAERDGKGGKQDDKGYESCTPFTVGRFLF